MMFSATDNLYLARQMKETKYELFFIMDKGLRFTMYFKVEVPPSEQKLQLSAESSRRIEHFSSKVTLEEHSESLQRRS